MHIRLLLGCILLSLIAFPAHAHHSTANFDHEHEQAITGTVSYFGFTNPHSFLDLKAANPKNGKLEAFKVFAPGRVLLTRYDWKVGDVKAGDRVTITGYPDRKDAHFMYLTKIAFASGKVWQRSQRIPE